MTIGSLPFPLPTLNEIKLVMAVTCPHCDALVATIYSDLIPPRRQWETVFCRTCSGTFNFSDRAEFLLNNDEILAPIQSQP